MMVWQKVFLAAAVLGAAVVADDAHEEAAACDFDQPGLSDSGRRKLISKKAIPCYRAHVDMEKLEELRDLPSLEVYREVIKGLCSHSQEISTCMAGVRNSMESCTVKNVSESFMLLSELADHILVSGCEQGGENLALLVRGTILLFKRPESLTPLKRCLFKSYPSLMIDQEEEVGLASESYIFYKENERAKRCVQYIDDEAYKSAAQWLNEVIHSGMKCKLPDEDRLVLCSEIDPSKLSINTLCQLKPFSEEKLYDFLEKRADHCYLDGFIDLDVSYPANSTDLDWLKATYQEACKRHRTTPECIDMVSAIGEHCLPEHEEKQFELEIQFMEEYINRLCVEDGAFLANVMHEVYKNVPEHGNAFKDCYETLSDDIKTEEQSLTNKGRKAYQNIVDYKKCLVGKLHESNDVAGGLETAIDDVLKKMKCVNPEDGAVVLCETINQEH